MVVVSTTSARKAATTNAALSPISLPVLGSESLFKSFTLTANGVLTRNEAVIELTGDDSVAHLAGAAVGDGTFHHDDTVFVTHAAERCESRQVFKKVLKNGAVGVFQGKILVKQGAQKTDGYQISQSLLLDDDSQFLAKPELEIYADDVKCSHGSTSGAIDETALFYLRSRGVPEKAAQSLLVLAFLAEAIAEIEDETIAEDIRSRLESWLDARHERTGHGGHKDILESWPRPRIVVRRHLSRGRSEAFAFSLLFVFLILAYVAQWPIASRQSFVAAESSGRATSAGDGPGGAGDDSILVWFGGSQPSGGPYAGRQRAMVWRADCAFYGALIAVAPLMLLQGLVAGMIGPGPGLIAVQVLVGVGFMYLWISMLIEAERG